MFAAFIALNPEIRKILIQSLALYIQLHALYLHQAYTTIPQIP